MARPCKICGTPVQGKKKYCDECMKLKRRQYFKNRYHNDEKFRNKHLKYAKQQRQKKQHLGSLYDYSSHPRDDFDQEEKIISNLKNKTFRKRNNKKNSSSKNNDDFHYTANKNYREAVSYEERVKQSKQVCECCGGTEFERKDGYIICKQCGLVEEIFCMSVFGSAPLAEDGLTIALRNHFRNKGGNLE